MRILFLHPNDVVTTPTTVRIVRLAQEMARKGHRCKLVYFIEEERRKAGLATSSKEEISDGDRLEIEELDPYKPLKNSIRLREMLKGFDLLHLQKAIPYAALPAMTASVWAGVSLHYDWDDLEEELARLIHRRGFYPAFISTFERRLPAFSRSVTCSSAELERMALNLGAIPGRVSWLPVGTDVPALEPEIAGSELRKLHGIPENAVLLVYSGHLEAGSGAKLFIDTVSELSNSSRNLTVHGLVLGGGLHLDAYRNYSAQPGIQGKFTFTGYLPRRRVPMYLCAADVNVVSVENSFYNRCKSPLKLLEAMAAGKPVVATSVGEIPRLLENPALMARPEPKELAERCLEVLQSDRSSLGAMLRKRVEEGFTWTHAAERLERAYGFA